MIKITDNKCDFCGTCVSVCPVDCIELHEAKLEIDNKICIMCKNCINICPIAVLEVADES